jgi:hypothetical protein
MVKINKINSSLNNFFMIKYITRTIRIIDNVEASGVVNM